MSNDKISKATAIKSILSDLKKGIDKKTILSKIVKKSEKDERTVRRWYDDAEKEYKGDANLILGKVSERKAEALGEVAKMDILSIAERQKILSDIAQGNVTITKPMMFMGEIIQAEVMPDFSDRKAAIDLLNKMDGSYSPIKTEHSGEVKTTQSIINIKITPPLNDY